ncbi:hypothetical protein CK556_00115 [Mesoplasma chauliocola]|uniref:PTS system, beta-glucoside-specific IIABC component n=1 Tax=Mesoplasma chauliocola TaxID=216427 RepID=A0A249SM79_9MOLU|nr:PTS glucose transporter subunit IIABC [Mesoplasma chauliocola]ASZ08775.1 hypothetical protein CK556_00115 [Mesoplasma chauliocola]
MEFKFYAPVDCDIVAIDKCSDPAFSQKLLGDGLLIKPKKGNFSLPFDEAELTMIFDTKHAYGLKINDIDVLIHCGLETVNLFGKPFKIDLQVNSRLYLFDELFEVDLKYLKERKISSETPIVFDKKIEIKNFKEGAYKKGDLVCLIQYEETKSKQNVRDFFSGSSNKYQKIASEINKYVGSKENYSDVYNCMTRLRFSIIDKNKIDENNLKKLSIVKQIVWNGDELQVVIGPDVYKVKNEVILQNEFSNSIMLTKEKKSAMKSFMSMIMAIMVKMIPVMTGTGIIQALMAILVITGVMPSIVTSQNPAEGQISLFDPQLSPIWVMLFVIARSATYFTAIVLAYTASDYFGLNPVYGVTVGIILGAPIIFFDGGQNGIGQEFIWLPLSKLETSNVSFNRLSDIFRLNPLGTKVFVVLPCIYFAYRIDSWVVKWIPISLELMFRPFIVFLVSAIVGFVIFTPLWNAFEALFGALMYYVGNAPFGLGVGIYVGIWQLCVIFGLHGALGVAIRIEFLTNNGWSYLGIAGSISVWSQVGALIGVALITRNQILKKQAYGMIPMGLLGLTEPILYGINLPKKRPLICGCVAAFFAGAFLNWVSVSQRSQTGLGIFELIGFFTDPVMGGTAKISGLTNGLLYTVGCLISFGGGITLTMLFYKEREHEKTLVFKTALKIKKLIFKDNEIDKELKNELNKEILSFKKVYSKQDLEILKTQEKVIQKYLAKLSEIETKTKTKEEKISKLYLRGQKLIKKNNDVLAEKIQSKIEELQKINFDNLENEKDALYNKIDFNAISKIQNEIMNKLIPKIKILEEERNLNLEEFKDEFKNNTNALLSAYNL